MKQMTVIFSHELVTLIAKLRDIQGDPYGRGKDYVDIKFKVPSQAWVADQPYS